VQALVLEWNVQALMLVQFWELGQALVLVWVVHALVLEQSLVLELVQNLEMV
jgi:hypothetical protein